jgi:hypothetical protein
MGMWSMCSVDLIRHEHGHVHCDGAFLGLDWGSMDTIPVEGRGMYE